MTTNAKAAGSKSVSNGQPDPMTPTVEQAIERAFLDFIRDDAPLNWKMTWNPALTHAATAKVNQALSDANLLAPAVGREGWRFDMENAPTGGEQFIGLDNYGAQVWLGEVYHLALSPAATPSMPSVEARAVWAWKPLGPLPTPPEGTPDER